MSAEDSRPFWMVYRVGARGPSRVHLSKDSALTEGQRVARQHPGEIVVILHAQDALKVTADGNLAIFDERFALANAGAAYAD